MTRRQLGMVPLQAAERVGGCVGTRGLRNVKSFRVLVRPMLCRCPDLGTDQLRNLGVLAAVQQQVANAA
jgi:hypothetical protein